MLLIACPYCAEERPETEFRQSGEAHLKRPGGNGDVGEIDDRTVAEMLYFRSNGRGIIFERWRHVHGCGRFFNAARHAVTDKFVLTYKAGQPKPEIDATGRLARNAGFDAHAQPDAPASDDQAPAARTEAGQ